MQGRLNASLKDKIQSLTIQEPYVWRLRLSGADYDELEKAVESCVKSESVHALEDEKNAITTVVYIAEWYKRQYQSGNKNLLLEGLNYEKLWTNSGISQKAYLYRDDNGEKRWQYSIYVLGGLAIQHELNRNDNRRFLKGLCRLYHGENYTIENLDEAARAAAFRESIRRKHSLYEYLRVTLNGEMPFDESELTDESSDVNRFVANIKAANDEILKVKFRLEWAVSFSPELNSMCRKLNVWFKPEEVGGELYQYLRYDRVHLWGVPNPEKQEHLFLYIRFLRNGKIVAPETMAQPIVTYLNHDVNDFVAFGAEKGVQVKHIPTCHFDKVELFIKDDAGNEYLAQEHEAMSYMQLWRADTYGDTWTSTQNAQRQTVLLYNDKCRLAEQSLHNEVYQKPFRDTLFGTSDIWNWVYIYDSVSLIDEKRKELTVYNRNGYDQITTRLYSNIIRYENGGYIAHNYVYDPSENEEPDVDYLPLIFSKADIIVRHFATKDAIRDAIVEEESSPEKIEYKATSGFYEEWTDVNKPLFGENMLRIWEKGRPTNMLVAYLPSITAEKPIVRDYENGCIVYQNIVDALTDEKRVVEDEIAMDGVALNPIRRIVYGDYADAYIVDVYRPTLIKEVLLDGCITRYMQGNEVLNLPYIYKNRVQVNDFSEEGYQSYNCRSLGSIYRQEFINISGNPNAGWAALKDWRLGNIHPAKELDPSAPNCLTVCFGRSNDKSNWEEVKAYAWSYDKNEEPKETAVTPEFGVVYQDIRASKEIVCNFPIQVDDDPWGFDDIDLDLVQCFEEANSRGIYFFVMRPLIDLEKGEYIRKIYTPLFEKRGGELTPEDRDGLLRLAEEFDFNWEQAGINIE